MDKVSIENKLSQFNDYYNPRIVGELNGQHVKVVKLKGDFIWHHHDHEDELFLVITGKLTMEFRHKSVEINPGEFIIVPRGVEHKPVANDEFISYSLNRQPHLTPAMLKMNALGKNYKKFSD